VNNDIRIRWMISGDMNQIIQIERLCFEFPWRKEDFLDCLRQVNGIGTVAVDGERVVGYMLYELHKNRLHILNFAVHPAMQRKGVGTAIHKNVAAKLTPERRNRLLLEVRETNLDALMFFKALGYRAVSVLRDYYDDTDEDAIVMQFRVQATRADAALAALSTPNAKD
jgi:ribosomal-protein-alanine N-acetyltransferase